MKDFGEGCKLFPSLLVLFLCHAWQGFILTEKILLSEQCQNSLAMPGNTTREFGVLEY